MTGDAVGKLEGTISITGLPPHGGMIVNLCFFAVSGPDAPPPHNGDPPTEAVTDCVEVYDTVDPKQVSSQTTFEHHFCIERQSGYFYVQVRVMLFRNWNGSVVVQLEDFFFAQRPIHVASERQDQITFPVSWPTEPLEALHYYGTVRPQRKRPWWQFW